MFRLCYSRGTKLAHPTKKPRHSCGGADLWAKTQAQYFARESRQRPFLKVVNAIIKSELGGLVDASDLGQWQETLAILSTYAKQVCARCSFVRLLL